MNLQLAINEVRRILSIRYPEFSSKSASERVLLAASVLADDVKVREKSGRNDGPWVGAILASTGLGEGFAWCAAFVQFCHEVASVKGADSAGVHVWWRWLRSNGRLLKSPTRGMIALKDYGKGLGHMGIVVRVVGPFVYTIEGNTSSGEQGSQRDGQGLYRRMRRRSWWDEFGEVK